MACATFTLPRGLLSRVAALARKTGRSAHSLIVEAVERHTTAEERMQEFIAQALVADAEIERTGEVYAAEDVHRWVERLARGKMARRPKPRLLSSTLRRR